MKQLISAIGVLSSVACSPAWAAAPAGTFIDLTSHGLGYAALIIFAVAYAMVMAEEFTHLRKSKPVILAAGILWAMVAMAYTGHGQLHAAEEAVRHNIRPPGIGFFGSPKQLNLRANRRFLDNFPDDYKVRLLDNRSLNILS